MLADNRLAKITLDTGGQNSQVEPIRRPFNKRASLVQQIEVRYLQDMTEMPELVLELRAKDLEDCHIAFGAPARLEHGILIKKPLDIPDLAVSGEIKNWGIDHQLTLPHFPGQANDSVPARGAKAGQNLAGSKIAGLK
jgi:hypothetical protein